MDSFLDLASILLDVCQGALEDAERHYQRSLTIREAHLGPHHVNVARSLLNLAILCDEHLVPPFPS